MAKIRVSVSLSPSTWNKVESFSEKINLSRSAIVEQALRSFFKELESKGYVPLE